MKRILIILFAQCLGELTGVITETKCGAAHKAGSEKDISCIKSCVKSVAGKLALLAGTNSLLSPIRIKPVVTKVIRLTSPAR